MGARRGPGGGGVRGVGERGEEEPGGERGGGGCRVSPLSPGPPSVRPVATASGSRREGRPGRASGLRRPHVGRGIQTAGRGVGETGGGGGLGAPGPRGSVGPGDASRRHGSVPGSGGTRLLPLPPFPLGPCSCVGCGMRGEGRRRVGALPGLVWWHSPRCRDPRGGWRGFRAA